MRKLCLFPFGESVAEIIGINTEQSTNIIKRAEPTGIVGVHPFFRLFEKVPLAAGYTGNRMLEGRNRVLLPQSGVRVELGAVVKGDSVQVAICYLGDTYRFLAVFDLK